ncbi:MAG: PD-(D/E)XK nuclease family protein [Chthonomonas sp.]|nr:PD-(D/E)XK nuclease family protein [Chthonomonas sp.]
MATRRPSVSPSRLSTYLACSLKYRWTFLDPRGRYLLRSHSYYSFGLSLHKVLERFHDSEDQGVSTLTEAKAALEESWLTSGYDSQQEMEEAWGTGVEILEGHVRQHLDRPSEATTIAVEKRMKIDLGQFDLVGQIDRLDEYPDGRLEIVDYKSMRSATPLDMLKSDLAMNCYQLMIREEFPDRPVTSTILALQTGDSTSYTPTSDELTEFRRELIFLGDHMLNRDWEHVVPTWKPLCRNCDFVSLCRKSGDFNEPEESEPDLP